MIDRSFLEYLDKSRAPATLEIHGRQYSDRNLVFIPRTNRPEHLGFRTLTSLVDYIRSNVDKLDPRVLMLHVMSHETVRLLGNFDGDDAGRTTYAAAVLNEQVFKPYQFGQWQKQEEFIISLQTLFVGTPMRADLLKKIGTMKSETVQTSQDDGVTQRVSASAGVALVETVVLPNPVILQPYRTFREIEQPESPFILRVRGGEQATCALFEADGGGWRLAAVESIAQYLRECDLQIPVFA